MVRWFNGFLYLQPANIHQYLTQPTIFKGYQISHILKRWSAIFKAGRYKTGKGNL
jgi:hypothetical protein